MARHMGERECLRLRNALVSQTNITHRYLIARDDGSGMKIISRRNDLDELIRFGKLYELGQGEHMLLVEPETLLVHWEKAGPLTRPYANA